MLASKFPIDTIDGKITLDDSTHTYTVDGEIVPISVTGLLDRAKGEQNRFDADRVARRGLRRWRDDASSKLHAFTLDKDDEAAIAAIKSEWREAATRGTRMHAALEAVLNQEPLSEATRETFSTELEQFEALRAKHPNLEVVRTELGVYGRDRSGRVVIAGQIDALVRDRHDPDAFAIVDFKRVARSLDADACAYGKTWLDGTVLNDLSVYSMQVATYRHLLQQTTGIRCKGAFLVQLHSELPTGRMVEATDVMRASANLLLDELDVDVGITEKGHRAGEVLQTSLQTSDDRPALAPETHKRVKMDPDVLDSMQPRD